MYELANTSLPNGLIPGTHGFATVAMTKGIPDALRSRLEAYCAYSHRTSAHDATYFRENPVNWFHVVLPQGEHVVGRVAPADFDYTGRTNRLARLLVFSKDEMPSIGGAAVLQKEHGRFTMSWSGEARWLEADKTTAGRLRLEMPRTGGYAPAWRAMFGEENGIDIARGFARQLATNMSGAGRTIYFKTSTAFDADGTKLLALFADLIDLLPVAERGKVAFSTYPVALPQGTTCHLRGVYDRDRIFDAAAATQAWVDCEKGIVHNATMLPAEGMETPKAAAALVSKASSPTLARTPVQRAQPSFNERVVPRRSDLILPQKDGTKTLFVGTIVASFIVVVALAGAVFWYCKEQRHTAEIKRKAEQELERIEEQKHNVEDPGNGQQGAREVKAEARENGKKTNMPKDGKKGENDGAKKAEDDIAAAKNSESKNMAEAKAKTVSVEHERGTPFSEVKECKIWAAGTSIKKKYQGKEDAMTNGTLCVFWYDDDGKKKLTNALAGFSMKKQVTKGIKTTPKFTPDPQELAKKSKGAFLIWLDVREKIAYWDWSPLEHQKFEAWFAKEDEINLEELCFGKDKEVRNLFSRIETFEGSINFEIEIEGSSKTISVDKKYFTFEDYSKFVKRISETKITIKKLEDKLNDIRYARTVCLKHAKEWKEKNEQSKDPKKNTTDRQASSSEREKIAKRIKDKLSEVGITFTGDPEEDKVKSVLDSLEEKTDGELNDLRKMKGDGQEHMRQAKFRIKSVKGGAK